MSRLESVSSVSRLHTGKGLEGPSDRQHALAEIQNARSRELETKFGDLSHQVQIASQTRTTQPFSI